MNAIPWKQGALTENSADLGTVTRKLIETLIRSNTYQNYERAYSESTGMPLTLRPVETWQLPFRGKRKENDFCALMAEQSPTCAACLRLQEKLAQDAMDKPATRTCAYGLCETAVPVKLGSQTIGFLQTGQVMRQQPTEASFQRAVDQAGKFGVNIRNERTKQAYFATPVASARKLDSVANLLAIFAEHLAIKSNQLVLQAANSEPPAIIQARLFIGEHFAEHLSLDLVSRHLKMSRLHFCKQFSRVTGVRFTAFISRTRIEKSKNLLLNPNLRISEIAYAVGFQTLSDFNRVFKKFMMMSPGTYRSNIAASA